MCIDGTAKFDEETSGNADSGIQARHSEIETLFREFEEVTAVNTSLLEKNIPVLILSVEKNRKGHIRELHQQIGAREEVEGVKMILYVEHTVDARDLTVALWRFCNNLDPKRDATLVQRPSQKNPGKTMACMGFDGTIKTKAFDDFQRDWPNIIVSDDATIKAVDTKWDRLGLGTFVPSPSLKFKQQLYGEEAIVQ
jgi:4-hydroxy-3-polyprenylbenzoate decarboxylase